MNLDTQQNKNNRIIYHIFKADAYFHTIDMIENIIKFSKYKHFFIVVGINELTKTYFDDLFLRYNYSQFTYIFDKSSSKRTRTISNLCKAFKVDFLEFEIDLLKYISTLSHKVFILHANYSTMFYLFFTLRRKINKIWVCWGSIYNLQNKNNLINKVRISLYKSIYSSYSNIICTMQEDCDHLNRLYKINNTTFIPYYSNLPQIADKLIRLEIKNENIIGILLGNSGRCIDSYYGDLKKLEIFNKNNIEIDCMLNYGSTDAQNSNLIKSATAVYGNKFKAHTNLLSKENYYNFMNVFDIYISSIESQSGLGAIYLLLLLGKKIFLAGKNYNHLKNLGVVIYHSDQIAESSFASFSQPLSTEEKAQNYSVIMKLLNIEELSLKWDQFYSKLIPN